MARTDDGLAGTSLSKEAAPAHQVESLGLGSIVDFMGKGEQHGNVLLPRDDVPADQKVENREQLLDGNVLGPKAREQHPDPG